MSVHVGGHRLDDFDAADQIGGNGIHRGTTRAGFGRANRNAVDRGVVQRGIDTADDDVATLVLIDLGKDTGQAAHRFGCVAVGQLPRAVGGDDVHQVVGIALLLQRAGLAFAFARHDEGVELQDAVAHRNIRAGIDIVGDLDGNRLVGVADIGRLKRIATCRHIGEGIAAIGGGIGASVELFDRDARSEHVPVIIVVANATRDAGGLSRCVN